MPSSTRFLSALQWILIGGWLGSWAFFAFVTARVAFQVLAVDAAGAIVGPTLHALHLYGLFAGIVLTGVGFKLHWPRALIVLVVLMSCACAITEFGVTAAIEQVRPSEASSDSAPDAGATFAMLHQLSMIIFSVVLLGVFALSGTLGWRAAPGSEPS